MPDEKVNDELVQKVINDYIWAKNYRAEFEEDWKRYYQLYKCFINDKDYPFESKLFIPYVFAIIEVQLPIMLQTLFGNGEFLDVQGRNIKSQELASSVKEIISYQFEKNIQAFNLCSAWAKQCMLYGTSPAFIDWKYLTRQTKIRVPSETIGGEVTKFITKIMQKVIANNPIAGVIDIFRYFQCPDTVDSPLGSDNVLFAGYEFQTTYEELLVDAKNSIYDMDAVKSLKDRSGNSRDLLEDRLGLLGKTSQHEMKHVARKILDCVNYFGMIPDDKGNLEYKLITLAFPGGMPDKVGGEAVKLRETIDPLHIGRIPISLARINLMQNELYGIGDVQTVESLQIELNDQRNQRCDNVVRSMNQMWKVKSGLSIDDAMLEYRPNGIIEVDNPDDITPLVPNSVQLSQSMVEENVIKQDIQFSSGVSDFIAGTYQNTTGFNDTATGISLIQAAAQGRIILKAQFMQVCIKELAEGTFALDQQFLPFETVIKVLDPFSASKFRFIKPTPQMLAGEYDFSIVNAPSTGNPQIRRQQLLQVMNTLAQLIPVARESGYNINIDYNQLVLRVLREFNIPNIAEIFPSLMNQAMVNNIPDFVNKALGAQSNTQPMDPEVENQLMTEGNTLPVNPGDDDLAHFISHQRLENSTVDAELKSRVQIHNRGHIDQLNQKRDMLLSNAQMSAANIEAGQKPGQLIQELLGGSQNGLSSPNGAGGEESEIRSLGNANAPAGQG